MNNDFFKTDVRKMNGTDIFYYENISDSDSMVVFVVHGLAEHAIRYEKFAQKLKNSNIGFAALDLPGHGKSTGGPAKKGVWPDNGFDVCIEAVKMGISEITKKHKKPVVLLGHSMGSFISLGYIEKYGKDIHACILSGTNDAQAGMLLAAGKLVSSVVIAIKGSNYRSKLLDSMSFGSFNGHFKPNRTAFDWLSRDTEEVDKYIADEYCGFVSSAGLFKSLLEGLSKIYKEDMIADIPKNLPVYIYSGGRDPVGEFGKGPKSLAKRLKASGVKDIQITIYADARHECLNEINSQQVTKDIIKFIKGV